jgi:hypothetical protein
MKPMHLFSCCNYNASLIRIYRTRYYANAIRQAPTSHFANITTMQPNPFISSLHRRLAHAYDRKLTGYWKATSHLKPAM